jgi:hypothetical protein
MWGLEVITLVSLLYCCPVNSACRALWGVPSPCQSHFGVYADGLEGARDDEIFLPDTNNKNNSKESRSLRRAKAKEVKKTPSLLYSLEKITSMPPLLRQK